MKKKITVILVSAVIVIAIVSVVLSLPKKPYKDLTADRGKGCPYGVNKYKISYKKAYPAIRFLFFGIQLQHIFLNRFCNAVARIACSLIICDFLYPVNRIAHCKGIFCKFQHFIIVHCVAECHNLVR